MGKLEFYSFAKQKDGGEYCSEIETYAENMIEGSEQESSIVYPSPTKFATFRAPDYRLTTDTLHMVLPLPIYKIVKVYIRAGSTGTEYANYENYKDGNGNSYIPDVTRFVVTEKEWSALPDFVDGGYIWGSNLAKSNTITYSEGSNEIWISSTENKRNSIEGRTPTYLGMIMSSFTNVTTTAYYYNGDTSNFSLRDAVNNGFFTELNIADVRDWQFQIEYIPMTPATKVKALKAEKLPRRYTQVVNQRSEVNNSEAFGKYLHSTAQKTGTEKIAVAKKYTKLSEVPPIGALIKHNGQRYRLVANSWNVTNTVNFTVTHLLSKNWSSKSKHVAVDQKYRNWNIPFDSYIWRTIYHEEFINLSSTPGAHDSSFAKQAVENALMSFFRMEPKDMELRMLTFAKGEDIQAYSGAVVPTVTQGVGHSIVISATMKDNISAGLRVNPDNEEYCTDVIYCNDDGTLDSGFIILANDIDMYYGDRYPACSYSKGMFSNNPKGMEEDPETAYFLAKYWIDKDPGEALKFTIQAHFVPREDWIVVGSKLAQDHPFIAYKPYFFKLWVLPRYIRDGADVLDPADIEGAYSKTLYSSSDMAWYFQSAVNKVEVIRTIFEEAEAEGIVGKSWVLTDGYNNIYIGSNDITKREIYFTWTRKNDFDAYVPEEPPTEEPDIPVNPDLPEDDSWLDDGVDDLTKIDVEQPENAYSLSSSTHGSVTGAYEFKKGNGLDGELVYGRFKYDVSFSSNGTVFSTFGVRLNSKGDINNGIYYDKERAYQYGIGFEEKYRTIDFGDDGVLVPLRLYNMLRYYATRIPKKGQLQYDYSFDKSYCICTGIGGVEGTDITVEDTYNGAPVKYIAPGAFRGNTNITSVTIGSNVEMICESAFEGCNSITSVTIGEGVTEIGESAFEGCNSLESIVIPDGVQRIKPYAFYSCASLAHVEIPHSVEYIGEKAFNGGGLQTVYYHGTREELIEICKDGAVTATFDIGITITLANGDTIPL